MGIIRFSAAQRGGLLVPTTRRPIFGALPLLMAKAGIVLQRLGPDRQIEITDLSVPDHDPCRVFVQTEDAYPPESALVHIVPDPGADSITPQTFRIPEDFPGYCTSYPIDEFGLELNVREVIVSLDERDIRSLGSIAVARYN